jgi:hypothetical protein
VSARILYLSNLIDLWIEVIDLHFRRDIPSSYSAGLPHRPLEFQLESHSMRRASSLLGRPYDALYYSKCFPWQS